MTCLYCASELPSGALLCGECGRSVTAKLTTTPERARARRRAVQPRVAPVPDATEPPPVVTVPDTEEHATELSTPLPVPASVPPLRHAPTVAVEPLPWGDLDPLEVDLEETRIVRRAGAQFTVQFSTGENVSVEGKGLIGRNPVPEPGEFFDSLVVITDAGKSVSKTHLEFGQDEGNFWISDRFSGNGTTVQEPDRPPRRLDAGKRYRIPRGSRVDIGEQFFILS
jgi:hypothetical protein